MTLESDAELEDDRDDEYSLGSNDRTISSTPVPPGPPRFVLSGFTSPIDSSLAHVASPEMLSPNAGSLTAAPARWSPFPAVFLQLGASEASMGHLFDRPTFPGRLPAPEELMQRWPKRAVSPASAAFSCPICLTDNRETVAVIEQDVVTLPCGHEFCVSCLRRWLEGNRSCPLCRRMLDEPAVLQPIGGPGPPA